MKIHLYVIEWQGSQGTGFFACGRSLRGKRDVKTETQDPRKVTCERCLRSKHFQMYRAGFMACVEVLRERVLTCLNLQKENSL